MTALQGPLPLVVVMIVPLALALMLGPSSYRVTDRDVRVKSRGFIPEYIIDFDSIRDDRRMSIAGTMIIPDPGYGKRKGVPVMVQPDDADAFVRRVKWHILS